MVVRFVFCKGCTEKDEMDVFHPIPSSCSGISNDDMNEANGIFPHECIIATCKTIVQYDDEPYCFEHSPDSGSSFPAFSARSRAYHPSY